MTNFINIFLHEYDFPYHDFLSKYKEELIESSSINLKDESKGFDTAVSNPEINNFLLPKLDKIVQDHYWVTPPLSLGSLRTYVQNNESSTSIYHHHASQPGALLGVFYIDPPEEGGELSFIYSIGEQPFNLKPKKNKLYLFPPWVIHAPLPQKDQKHRICFNWTYESNVKPVHKVKSNIIW